MENSYKESFNLGEALLLTLFELAKLLPLPLESPGEWTKRQRGFSRRQYSNSLYNLKKKGMVKVVQKNNQKFVQVTNKGQLEILLLKTHLDKPAHWDGKWRLFMFDIPEDSKEKRFQLRVLLKRNNFTRLQASVYASPYPINREGVDYLKRSGLMSYIRIAKVDEFDDDKDLKQKFGLK